MTKAKFRCVLELDQLEMFHATDILTPSSRHTHDTLTLGIIEQGTALLSYRGVPHPIASGHTVVINPDDAHACHPKNSLGYSQRMMYPSVALLQQATDRTSCHCLRSRLLKVKRS